MKKLLLTGTLFLAGFIISAQPLTGLVAYWPMNGNFTDNGPNNIATTNTGTTSTTNFVGTANTAMLFSNPTATVVQYATPAINAALNFTGDFSLDFSVFLPSLPHTAGFFDNCINYGGYGGWFWNPSGFIQLQFNFKNNSLASVGNGTFVLNTWYHICCLRSAGTLKLYVNGTLNNSVAEGPTAPVYNYNPRIGSMWFATGVPPLYNGLNGKLDEMRIYNRALTPAEISSLWQISLPVKLTGFTALKRNNDVALQWQTATEQNSSHFNVQRSTDAVNFDNAGTIKAAGNSSILQNYQYIDKNVQANGTIFYRLDMIDKDGAHSYSQVIAIHFNKEAVKILVSPNPATDFIQVQTNADISGTAVFSIHDLSGKEWMKKDLRLQPGTNSNSFFIGSLTAGTYILRLNNGNETYVKQFVKQ